MQRATGLDSKRSGSNSRFNARSLTLGKPHISSEPQSSVMYGHIVRICAKCSG